MESEISNNGNLRLQTPAISGIIVLIITVLQSSEDRPSFTKVFQKYRDLVSNMFRMYFKIKSFSSKNKIMLEFYKNPEEKFEIRFSLALPSGEKMNRSGIRHRATKSRGKEDGDGSGSSHASESKPGYFETNSSSLKYGGEVAVDQDQNQDQTRDTESPSSDSGSTDRPARENRVPGFHERPQPKTH